MRSRAFPLANQNRATSPALAGAACRYPPTSMISAARIYSRHRTMKRRLYRRAAPAECPVSRRGKATGAEIRGTGDARRRARWLPGASGYPRGGGPPGGNSPGSSGNPPPTTPGGTPPPIPGPYGQPMPPWGTTTAGFGGGTGGGSAGGVPGLPGVHPARRSRRSSAKPQRAAAAARIRAAGMKGWRRIARSSWARSIATRHCALASRTF